MLNPDEDRAPLVPADRLTTEHLVWFAADAKRSGNQAIADLCSDAQYLGADERAAALIKLAPLFSGRLLPQIERDLRETLAMLAGSIVEWIASEPRRVLSHCYGAMTSLCRVHNWPTFDDDIIAPLVMRLIVLAVAEGKARIAA